jgi:hypothetical protein
MINVRALSLVFLQLLLLTSSIAASPYAAFVVVPVEHGRGRSARSSKASVPSFSFARDRTPCHWDTTPPFSLVRMKPGDEEEDDGWGTNDEEDNDDKSTGMKNVMKSSPPTVQQGNNQPANQEPERDFFIPIFSLVSLAGLFGSYAYEMLRLNSRGELYLPWDHK